MNTSSIRKRFSKPREKDSHHQIHILCDEIERLQRKVSIMNYLQIQLLQLVQQCQKRKQFMRKAA